MFLTHCFDNNVQTLTKNFWPSSTLVERTILIELVLLVWAFGRTTVDFNTLGIVRVVRPQGLKIEFPRKNPACVVKYPREPIWGGVNSLLALDKLPPSFELITMQSFFENDVQTLTPNFEPSCTLVDRKVLLELVMLVWAFGRATVDFNTLVIVYTPTRPHNLISSEIPSLCCEVSKGTSCGLSKLIAGTW